MIWRVTSSREIAAIQELQSNPSDRAVGIVIASFVEMHLTDLIQSCFIKETKRKTVADSMLQPSGPTGAFLSKIRLAYLLGMISEECFKNLDNMREIRNIFAHNPGIGTFENPAIRDRCRRFTMVDRYIIDPKNGVHGDADALFGMEVSGAVEKLKNPKERYVLCAQVLSIGLQDATPNAKARKPRF